MRIICPDCGAQYEVPEEAIPIEGRDVQCSNCNSTWFCEHPDNPGTAEPKAEDIAEPDDASAAPPREDAHEDEDLVPPDPQRRELDPKVASILREEARRETEARKAEGLETQPELGLGEGAAPVARPAQEDPVRPHPVTDAPQASAAREEPGQPDLSDGPARDARGPDDAPPAPPRRDLLPDVEEINSSLRSKQDRAMDGDEADLEAAGHARRRGGFKGGFLAAVVIFVIGVLLYQFAPQIARAVPEVDPWLSNYVTWADEMRLVLDQQVRALLEWLDEVTTTSS